VTVLHGRFMNSLSYAVVLLAGIAWLLPGALWASIRVSPPADPVYQGQPLTLSVTLVDQALQRGELFYRPVGTRYFQRIPLQVLGRQSARAIIPASAVVAPGMEYYVRIIDPRGRPFTAPLNAPATVHRLAVRAAPAPGALTLLSPATDAPLQATELRVEISADPDRFRFAPDNTTLLLDDTDVSSLARFSDGRLWFSTGLMPAPGEHTLLLAVADSSGRMHEKSWTFTVGEAEGEAGGGLFAEGGLSFNYGNQLQNSAGTGGDSASANLNLEAGLRRGQWETRLRNINLQYVKDSPTEDVTLSSGFNLSVTDGEQLAEYGDVSIRETALSAPSFARRGFRARLKGAGNELRLFNVNAETVTGMDAGIGDSGQQVYGLSLSRSLLSGDRLPMTLAYITGENQAASGDNSASTGTPSQGDVLALALEHSAQDTTLKTELARSGFDADTTDGTGKQGDFAGTVDLSQRLGQHSLGASYRYYGTDFASIANPNFTSDRESLAVNAGAVLGVSNLGFSLSRSRDNVGDDASRPVVVSTAASISYGFAAEPWPSFNASYSRAAQNSSKEPAGSQPVKNINDTLSIALAKSAERWNLGLNTSYSRITDDIGSLDSETRAVNLSGGYLPANGLNLNLSLSLNESTSASVLKTTRIAALTASGSPGFADFLNTSLQISYTENDASDGSQDSTNLNGTLRLSADISRYSRKWLRFDSGSLALSANLSDVTDRVNPGNDIDSRSVFLTINLFSPINGL